MLAISLNAEALRKKLVSVRENHSTRIAAPRFCKFTPRQSIDTLSKIYGGKCKLKYIYR